MPNKKDICPVCGINEKGVRAKTCRPCSVKALADIHRKAEEKNNLLTKAIKQSHDAIDVSESVDQLDVTPDPEVQPKYIGIDLAEPDLERSVLVTMKPDKELKFKEQKVKGRPVRVGDITTDGKFYK
ncbi:MAG: hypothetical protein DRQ35_06275 [Gammaproteobacteria bacterium]|nr:MAG: hypothetical protein DRQ35_06275 [Gammaproteobacteria bacterium]